MKHLIQKKADLVAEFEKLKIIFPQLEAEWRNAPNNHSSVGNVIGTPERNAASEKVTITQSRINAIPKELDSIQREIDHLERVEKLAENKAKSMRVMSKAEDLVKTLEQKKEHLIKRLEAIQSEVSSTLETAQQTERYAAGAYARSLISGGVEAESSANSELQKASKQLLTTNEQVRRQNLILTALKVELELVDSELAAATKHRDDAKMAALDAVELGVCEEWDAATALLAALGEKLVAISYMKGGRGDSLTRLKVPRFGPSFTRLEFTDLTAGARVLSLGDLLNA
ncbi:hypothetical protein [Pseudomonas viridiflava]|uniref:hypothetical protein n=2 Tax=Pseudomonas viridiflava TaxID=33069 RepID=UPI000F03E556|nr:hypothetical protein [Pseudomonas viridiflava]MEE4082198.1 hypothetical protein [Pseudomonas viridiflava]